MLCRLAQRSALLVLSLANAVGAAVLAEENAIDTTILSSVNGDQVEPDGKPLGSYPISTPKLTLFRPVACSFLAGPLPGLSTSAATEPSRSGAVPRWRRDRATVRYSTYLLGGNSREKTGCVTNVAGS